MFENPLMLAGVGGAVVPLALHMLSRARYEPVQWGAMMFLEGAGENDLRAHRVRLWSLLGLRMAAVALLAVALARPLLGSDETAGGEEQRVTAAIVVDCSASMAYDEGGRTRMDLARSAALQILSSLKRGDEAVLLTMGGSGAYVGERAARAALTPTGDLEAVANRVSDLEPGDSSANVAEGLTNALNMLDRVGRRRKQLYVICDRQASSWAQITENYAAAWGDRAEKSSKLDRLAVIPVGSDASSNVAVESIEPVAPPAVRGTGSELEVRVRNFGSEARVNVPVTVLREQQEIASERVNLPPRSTTTVTVKLPTDEAGTAIFTASIRARGLATDDRLRAAIAVVDPVRTLVVREGIGENGGELVALRAALAPDRGMGGRGGGNLCDVVTVTPGKLAGADLAMYSVIVLSDVAAISKEDAAALERFVEGGGGLLISLGAHVRPRDWNEALFRNGEGMLPAALGDVVEEVGDAPIQVDALDHEAFRFLHGRGEDVTAAMARRMELSPAAGAVTLARTPGGDPLLVEKRRGRGTVILLGSTLSSAWGNLPATAFFPQFVRSTVKYLASAGMDRLSLRSGEEMIWRITDAVTGKPTVTLPDGTTAAVDVVVVESVAQLRYGATQQPGIYVMRVGTASGERVNRFVVQGANDESDLNPLSAEQWEWLAKSLSLVRVDRAQEAVPVVAEATRHELWLWLVVGVIAVLVAEMGLTRLWYRSR
ncbi:MAG TPA: BatA domain-containing protein [Tepidisphaeraceae bacterium]|jgi:hypothetical protein